MIWFEGTIREHRRGGWNARGAVLTQRSGQIFETQLGPRAFESEEDSREWLHRSAVEHRIRDVRIAVNGRRDADNRFEGG